MDKKVLSQFIQLLGKTMKGKWVLLGGSVLPFLEASSRITQDIDIVGPMKASTQQTIELMEIAQKLGLPVEAINQAASFFLYKIEGWEKELVLIHPGSKAHIFRPSATLYLLLKLNRLSETDLDDCVQMIQYARAHNEPIDKKRIRQEVKKLLKKRPSPPKTLRAKRLLGHFYL